MDKEQNQGLPRRGFLKWGIGTIGAVIGLGYVGLIGDFLKPQSANAAPLQEVGKVDDFPERVPKLVTYKGSGSEEGIYVINPGGDAGSWLALDFHCTHLQCAVNWVEAVNKFVCPCHGGVYDLQGNVLSGPPPESLRRRVIKLNGDSVMVGGMLV